MIVWKAKGKDRSISPREVRGLEEKLRARGELLTFAAKHPGALSGFFLAMVHEKLSRGRVCRTGDLRKVSVASWAERHCGLNELRDQREVATLSAIMDAVNARDLSLAMDTLAQRILAVQQAKKTGARGRTPR